MRRNLFLFTAFLLFWQGIHKVLAIPTYILPTPLSVLIAFYHQSGILWKNAYYTAQLIFVGFLSSIILAFATAIALDHFPRALSWIRSIIFSLQSIPSIILLPLLIIWFGYGFFPRLAIMILSCYFPITLCCINGLNLTPEDYKILIRSLNGGYWESLYHVRLPAALPYIFSGLQIAAIGAPLNAIAVDWVGSSQGLGYLIMLSHGNLKTDLMIASTILVIAIAYALYRFVNFAKNQVLFWEI